MSDYVRIDAWGVLAGEALGAAALVQRVDFEIDASTELRRGTVEVACRSDDEAETVKSLVGTDVRLYLKSNNGEVYLVTLDKLIVERTQRFAKGTTIARGKSATQLTEQGPLERLIIVALVWQEQEWRPEDYGRPVGKAQSRPDASA